MESKAIRKANIRALIRDLGSVKKFAERVDTDPNYVSSIISENLKRGPGDNLARKIEQAFGYERGWLDMIHTDQIQYDKNLKDILDEAESEKVGSVTECVTDEVNDADAERKLAKEFVLVPRYDVKASMGHGQPVYSEQVVDHLAFKRNWVQVELGINPKNLALITAIGDSMEPTLRPGDLILLDRSVDHVKSDSVYVIAIDGELLAKRIQRKFDGSLIIKSDNKEYDPQTLTPEQADDLRIIGRVIWAGRRM